MRARQTFFEVFFRYEGDTKNFSWIFLSLKLQIEQATRDCSASGITNGSTCTK